MYKKSFSRIKWIIAPVSLLVALLAAYHLFLPTIVTGEMLADHTEADLSRSLKLASRDALPPGEVLTYTILLHNSGDSDATADVTDMLPPQVNYVVGSANQGGIHDPTGGTLSWSGITVPAGGDAPLTYAVTATVDAPTEVINTAVINDPAGGFQQTVSSMVLLLPEQPDPDHDLSGSMKYASRDVLPPNEVLTYTILLRNSGDNDAIADVTDILPTQVNYVVGSANQGGVHNPNAGTLSWSGITAPAGGDAPLTYAVTATVDAPTEAINTAVISEPGSGFELNISNMVLLLPEQPDPSHDLSGSVKYASRDALPPGEVLTYTILLRNSGDSDVIADVTDMLPPQVNYVVGSANQGGVHAPTGGTLSWSGITVPAGGDAPLTYAVTATVDAPTEAINTAVIRDLDGGFQQTVSSMVWLLPEQPDPSHDLSGSMKYASQDVLPPGEVLTYTILLCNSGDSDVIADVTDMLPTQVNYVVGSANQGGVYDPNAGTLSWSGIMAPAGGDTPLTYAVTANVNTPTEAINTAVIRELGSNFELNISNMVWLLPEQPDPNHDLSRSMKYASQDVLPPGEVLTYTILLHNSGDSDIIAGVTDMLPSQMNYVVGSANQGGAYDPAIGTLSWVSMTVPAQSDVALTFAVTATVNIPQEAINTAFISADGTVLERNAWVWLTPERPDLGPDLSGSLKFASRDALPPGEVLTYTILLHNSGVSEAVADVIDMLPAQVNYVAGSANQGGVCNPAAGTLSWHGIIVPVGQDVSLTYAVTATVDTPTEAINTALISSFRGNFQQTVEVSHRILLLPERPDYPPNTPLVHSLTIGEQDVLTSPTVTLHISATDDGSLCWMYLQEWKLTMTPWPRWEVVQSSGWLPYQAEHPWTLGAQNGTHFVGVWVADDTNTISPLNTRALDFASLVQLGATLGRFGMESYRVYYQAGVTVMAGIDSPNGDTMLDVWYLGDLSSPIVTSTNQLTFDTQQSGDYMFLAYGSPGAVYNLNISPAGGPRRPVEGMGSSGAGDQEGFLQTLSAGMNNKISMVLQNGIDPLGVATAPNGPFVVYLPVLVK